MILTLQIPEAGLKLSPIGYSWHIPDVDDRFDVAAASRIVEVDGDLATRQLISRHHAGPDLDHVERHVLPWARRLVDVRDEGVVEIELAVTKDGDATARVTVEPDDRGSTTTDGTGLGWTVGGRDR